MTEDVRTGDTCDTCDEMPRLGSVRRRVEQVWKRARVNAFAHREAANQHKMNATWYFKAQVGCGLGAQVALISAYMANAADCDWLYTILAVLAVLSSAFGLAFGILQNYFGHEREHVSHRHNQQSYLYIAQRAREVAWPGIDYGKAKGIMEDLERDFQVLKARGPEPENENFDAANVLFGKLQEEDKVGKMQSFSGSDGVSVPGLSETATTRPSDTDAGPVG